jgi:hypothetical protein
VRIVPAKMTEGWKREDKTGDFRPIARATIQRVNLQRFAYDTAQVSGGDWDIYRHRKGHYTSVIFGEDAPPVELTGLQQVNWERSTDQDVGTFSIEMLNTEVHAIGDEVLVSDAFDTPGAFTYNRGMMWTSKGPQIDPNAPGNSPWGYEATRWRNLIVPDRMVRTYEGYGADYSVMPAADPNQMISGTWLIDKVTYTMDGRITIEGRDVGRMLLTHICFPPAVPFAEYPLMWSKIQTVQVPGRDSLGGSWKDLKDLATAQSSNMKYVGEGLVDPPYPYYVSENGHVNGHHPNHALDSESNDREKYWMSTGQTTRDSFAWWQATFHDKKSVAGVRINPVAGPYRIYISIETDDGWVGRKKIPYSVTTEGVDIDAKIPFVQSVWAERGGAFEVTLKRKYRNVKRIRLTFTSLNDNKAGDYPWRAMLKSMKVYTGKYDDLHFGRGTVAKTQGNYRDYTHIVKWMCAWGGFYWPPESSGRDFWMRGDGDRQYVHPDHHDPRFTDGRVWGTFQPTGTAATADLTVDLFDKKPFMDVINYVRDIVGFIFMIDEWGGVIWRLPSLYPQIVEVNGVPTAKPGNYISPDPLTHSARVSRTRSVDQYVTIDEKETLLDYSTVLDSENLRERIFVADATGKVGTVVRGFNPTFDGFRRTAGWTDQNFKTKRETTVMADMIAAQQMFDYRRTSLSTPGYPAIQVDDQIRVFERVTNETYFHYVLGIRSSLNMVTGEWTYDLNTHWLGDDRTDAWVVDPYQLDAVTREYLNVLKGNESMVEEDDQ